jgi:hypothetical protein
VKYTLQFEHDFFFQKNVTKERLELKTSYLIRKLLTKWSSKTYCIVWKEDWGCLLFVFVVVVEDDLGESAKKKLFSHKNLFLLQI